MFFPPFGVQAHEHALQNYVELETILKGETTSAADEKEISTLRTVQDELSTKLEVKKAKVRSLEENISTEKSNNFKVGLRRGAIRGSRHTSHF